MLAIASLLALLDGDLTKKPVALATFDTKADCEAELGDTLHLYLMDDPRAILWCTED